MFLAAQVFFLFLSQAFARKFEKVSLCLYESDC